MSQQEPTQISAENAAARVESVAALMADPDARVRKSCVVALGKMDAPGAAAQLARALDDADEGVRVLACQALGRKTGEELAGVLPALVAHVHDASGQVRSGVLWALANAVAHAGLDADTLAGLFTPVTVLAFDPDDGVRADAAAVLGTLRDERATDALTVLLEDEVARVRANACASLGLTDDEAGEALLLARVAQAGEDALVRVSAVDALARRCERDDAPHARVLPGLLACCADEDADVASTAVWALGFACEQASELRGQVQGALSQALAGANEWAARYAVESLARIHDDAARQLLDGFDPSTSTYCDALAPLVTQALATFE